ncbi:hypothetical protein YPH_4091 [Yersinia pestis biovar Orientalis str. PEXU2]|nr:hypothetical protein YPH_4091 [Yersinia pestis biovar Orientalis str. PEXU2]
MTPSAIATLSVYQLATIGGQPNSLLPTLQRPNNQWA